MRYRKRKKGRSMAEDKMGTRAEEKEKREKAQEKRMERQTDHNGDRKARK